MGTIALYSKVPIVIPKRELSIVDTFYTDSIIFWIGITNLKKPPQ